MFGLFKKKQPKRVVEFHSYFDKIPSNAKYLFSRANNFQVPETDFDRAQRIITGTENMNTNILYSHFYEIDQEDFERLTLDGIFTTPLSQKIENFKNEFNINF